MTREVEEAGVAAVDAGRPEVDDDEEAALESPPGSSSSVRWSSTSSSPCSSYAGRSSMARAPPAWRVVASDGEEAERGERRMMAVERKGRGVARVRCEALALGLAL